MIYLSSFRLSKRKVNNPNIYPYNVFRDKYIEPFVFRPITVLYGNNGSGKSTLLNIIANCLQLKGKEYATSNSFGSVDYCGSFSRECLYTLGEDDYGNTINNYRKIADILKVKIYCMRLRRYNKSRYYQMAWSMITLREVCLYLKQKNF